MGLQSLHLNSGIQGPPHLNLYQGTKEMACWAKSRLSWVSSLQEFPGMGSAEALPQECSPPRGAASFTAWTWQQCHAQDSLLLVYELRGGKQWRGWTWFPRCRVQGQGQTTCVKFGPVQCRTALALSSNDVQFWGRGCWKMGHLGAIGVHLNWGCWDFFPNSRCWGTKKETHTQSLCHTGSNWDSRLQSGEQGFGGHIAHVYWPLVLDPVRFYPGLGVGEVFSPSSAYQWRICWLNKAVSSSWLTAPFWSNLLTFFLIFLNSKH